MQIATRSQDEVGQLAQNFNQFVARLHGIVSRLRDVTVELAAQSRTQAAGPRPAASGCASSRTRSSWWPPQ